ncbi:MAG TPA: glycosyltransferase [Chitinophagaceae bacterium]|nr:glycosyltransferase [Chitinophagaceae bacterium]
MKILLVNWTLYPSGGDWTYVETLWKFYESRGHEVIPFSMEDERNIATPYSKYFISKIDYKTLNKNKSPLNAIKAVKNSVYSYQARKNIKKLLAEHKIDAVHLNNIHHYLSPASIIPEIKKYNIPIIWTLHDYVILCPNTTFISKDKVCEKCKGGTYYHCILKKCKKNSAMASTVAALESYTNKWVDPYKYVDYFLCPSHFIANKFIEFGYDERKMVRMYNPFDISQIETSAGSGAPGKKYIIYVGNILRVKGVFTLAEAVKSLDIDLYIVGDGEFMPQLQDFTKQNAISNVYFLGKQNKYQLFDYVRKAQFVVVPSEWYENLPYSAVEALLLSKPVIGAKIGGIPELVIDNKTGYLFEPGNVTDLKNKIIQMLSLTDEELSSMGRAANLHAKKMVDATTFEEGMKNVFASIGREL